MVKIFAVLSLMPGMLAATNLIVNGGFEAGFSNWTTSVISTSAASIAATGPTAMCATPWVVGSGGAATNCETVANPIGTLAAYSSFDGPGDNFRNGSSTYSALTYRLEQTFTVPNNIMAAEFALRWSWYVDTPLTYGGTMARFFRADLFDPGTNTTYALTSLGFVPSNVIAASGSVWGTPVFDISNVLLPLQGSTVVLRFDLLIPEYFTGPAGFGLDNVAIEVSEAPEPGVGLFVMAGLGLLGWLRRRNDGARL
jgi:MYXO-CTERM domain-containing protein